MIYALWTYHWRAASIRRGGRGPYDDRVGPVSTSIFLTFPRLPLTRRIYRPFSVLPSSVCALLPSPSLFLVFCHVSNSPALPRCHHRQLRLTFREPRLLRKIGTLRPDVVASCDIYTILPTRFFRSRYNIGWLGKTQSDGILVTRAEWTCSFGGIFTHYFLVLPSYAILALYS